MKNITLLIHCKDQSGIIASVTNFIAENKGNIVYIDQHVDREQDIFFMRLESEFSDASFSIDLLKDVFKDSLAERFEMKWSIYSSEEKINMALFVSKYDHCLYDLLGRYNSGELNLEIPLLVLIQKIPLKSLIIPYIELLGKPSTILKTSHSVVNLLNLFNPPP